MCLRWWFCVYDILLNDKTKYIVSDLKKETNFNSKVIYRDLLCHQYNECNNCLKIGKLNEIKYLAITPDDQSNWKNI